MCAVQKISRITSMRVNDKCERRREVNLWEPFVTSLSKLYGKPERTCDGCECFQRCSYSFKEINIGEQNSKQIQE